MLTIYVDVEGAVHKFELAAEQASDLTKPLKIMMSRLRKRAVERYKAQGFAPLAQSTLEKRAEKGLRQMREKLTADLEKTFGKVVAERQGKKGMFTRLFEGAEGRTTDAVLAGGARTVQNRRAVLAVFQQRHGAGRGGLMAVAAGKKLTLKQGQSLATRTVKQVQKAVNKPVLGDLAGTLFGSVNGDEGTLKSRTGHEWSEVHNKGGTAGHGAQIPQRETLKIEQSDLDFFVSVLKDHCLLPFAAGMHGPGY